MIGKKIKIKKLGSFSDLGRVKRADKEVDDLIKSSITDFYINLPNYKHFIMEGFKSDDLSLVDLVSIAEFSALEPKNSLFISNDIDVAELMGTVMYRLGDCSDMTTKGRALDFVNSLMCMKGVLAGESALDGSDAVENIFSPKTISFLADMDYDEIPKASMGDSPMSMSDLIKKWGEYVNNK